MDTVDVLIHIHPELSPEVRSKIELEVMANPGVISADFSHHEHSHALTVLYNPDAVQSKQILSTVKLHDPEATMIGL